MSATTRGHTENFLLVVDLLPLRLRGVVATELPMTAMELALWAGSHSTWEWLATTNQLQVEPADGNAPASFSITP